MESQIPSNVPSRLPRVRGLTLSSGRRCRLSRPRLPGLQRYYVVALPGPEWTHTDVAELHALAHRIGRRLALQHFRDAECYSLLYNAARTRRKPWPHVHILVSDSVVDKRRSLAMFQLKHVLRWRRWPLVRRFAEGV